MIITSNGIPSSGKEEEDVDGELLFDIVISSSSLLLSESLILRPSGVDTVSLSSVECTSCVCCVSLVRNESLNRILLLGVLCSEKNDESINDTVIGLHNRLGDDVNELLPGQDANDGVHSSSSPVNVVVVILDRLPVDRLFVGSFRRLVGVMVVVS
jgi:hypothetical protein